MSTDAAGPEILSLDLMQALPGPDEAAETVVETVPPPPPQADDAETNGHPKKSGLRLSPKTEDLAAKWAKAALDGELGKLASVGVGERNIQLNKAAFALGQIVGGGNLSQSEVEQALQTVAERIGLGGLEILSTIRSGIVSGKLEPRTPPERPTTPNKRPSTGYGAEDCPEPPQIDADDVATIDDLIKAGSQIEWAWEGWIPIGVLVAIAAKGGTGKTRFCADLVRRIRRHPEWPDGKPITLPATSLVLWVVADNHHDEMVTLTQSFGIADVVRINASKADPYGGVSLETRDDYLALEARIKAVKPVFVIIDTVGNATDKNLSRQEDAKAFYQPLQVIARKYRTSILCLTHLNASGQFLGRRVMEKVRLAIRLDQFEGEDRRRLEVIKSNSKRPAALGVTMQDGGNEYDDRPPEPPEEGAGYKAGPKPPTEAELKAMAWLKDYLQSGPKRVSITRTAGEAASISSDRLYAAKKFLNIHEYTLQGYKWWSLTIEEVSVQ